MPARPFECVAKYWLLGYHFGTRIERGRGFLRKLDLSNLSSWQQSNVMVDCYRLAVVQALTFGRCRDQKPIPKYRIPRSWHI
jgi:hypothetical protein